MLLKDKVVLITGAGSTVGQAAAALFRAEGGVLALADLVRGRAPQRADGPASAAPEALLIDADLVRAEDCQRMVRTTLDAFGRIDVLCNTVGIDLPSATTVEATSEADWDRIMEANLKSVFLVCKHALPAMVKQGAGVIINTASQGAILALPNMAAYGTSKAAVLQLTRQIATDYAAHGIRANCVCPSGLERPSLDRLTHMDAAQLERRAIRMRQAVPLGRLCTPSDVARAMLFLASDAAGFITGVALPIDGGTTSTIRL